MASKLDTAPQIGERARNMIRDFPLFFEETFQPLPAPTIRLPHPLIAQLELRSVEDGGLIDPEDYVIDHRNGVIKFKNYTPYQQGVNIFGYHYSWFLPDDLEYYADVMIAEHMHGRTDIHEFAEFSYEEKHVTAIGAAVYAMFSLLTELSTDIDISTPEGIMIPAHMRFGQVQQLYDMWLMKYRDKAAMLNIGLERIEIYSLRRVTRLTNRYAPVWREREIDDPRPPVRVFPAIPPVVPTFAEGGSEGSGGYNPDYGISHGGWNTLGTAGH